MDRPNDAMLESLHEGTGGVAEVKGRPKRRGEAANVESLAERLGESRQAKNPPVISRQIKDQ